MHKLAAVSITGLVTLVFVFLTLPTPAAAFPSAPDVVGLYLREGPTAPVAGFTPSESTTGGKVSILAASGTNPCVRAADQGSSGCASTVLLGSSDAFGGLKVTGDAAVSLWLSTNAPTALPLRSITVNLVRINAAGTATTIHAFSLTSGGNTSTANGFYRDMSSTTQLNLVPTLGSTPVRVTMGSPRYIAPFTVAATDKLGIQIGSVGAVAVTGTIDVFAHYGKNTQTVIAFQAIGGEAVRSGTKTLGVYLDDNAITFDPPTSATDKKRAVGTSASANNPTEIVWGTKALDEDITVAGDAIFGITLLPKFDGTGNVEPRFAVEVRLTLGTKLFTGTTSYSVSTGVATAAPTTPVRFISLIPMTPGTYAAGTAVKLGIRVFAVTGAAGDYEVLYGSAARPSGVVLPVIAAASEAPPPPAPSPSPSPSPTTSEPSPTPSPSPSPTTSPSPTPAPSPTSPSPSPAATSPQATTKSDSQAGNAPIGPREISQEPLEIPSMSFVAALAGAATVVWILARRR